MLLDRPQYPSRELSRSLPFPIMDQGFRVPCVYKQGCFRTFSGDNIRYKSTREARTPSFCVVKSAHLDTCRSKCGQQWKKCGCKYAVNKRTRTDPSRDPTLYRVMLRMCPAAFIRECLGPDVCICVHKVNKRSCAKILKVGLLGMI